MQPYRNITSNRFLPIYWTDCRQCSCENCICRGLSENARSTSPTPNAEVRRSSFTIESLLSSKDEQKSTDVKPGLESPVSRLNMALIPSATGQFPNDRSSELIHGSGYLPSFRRQSFGFEQVSMLARGNIQANGE